MKKVTIAIIISIFFASIAQATYNPVIKEFVSDASGHQTFNNSGEDKDFKVGGTSDANLLNVDAGQNKIGVGLATPDTDALFHVNGAIMAENGVTLKEKASAPPAKAGYGKLYVNSSDHELYFLDNGGTATQVTGGGISSLAEDSTPDLSGNLNTNGQSITSESGQNIAVTPGGTGDFLVDTDTLVVDSSANRVGIKDTTPSYELDVAGTINGSTIQASTTLTVGGVAAVDLSSSQTLTNKTLTSAGNTFDASNTTTSGMIEVATTAEIETGTDNGRAMTPDFFAASNFGERNVAMTVFDFTTDTATGDGKAYFYVPASLDGMDLVAVHAQVITAGTTGTTDIQIARCDAVASGNACSGTVADMLSAVMKIDSGEDSSDTGTVGTIDTANDDLDTNDVLRIDVDAVSTTAAKGLIVTMTFRLP